MKRIYAGAIAVSSMMAVGGFIAYQRAQGQRFVRDYKAVVDSLANEYDFRTAIDKYRDPILSLSKESSLAMKQGFYVLDQTPEPDGAHRIIRTMLEVIVVQRAYVNPKPDGTADVNPWVQKADGWHIQWNESMELLPTNDNLSSLFDRFDQGFKRRDPSSY